MSDSGGIKRDTSNLVKWALAALSAIIVISVIGYGLIQQSAYSQSAANRSADYSENAAAQINQACAGVAKLEKPICIEKAATEYRLQARDKQREYDDLAAQQTSALWTSIMGIAALIGMGLSAVGVFLVYTTFRETRNQSQAVREQVDMARAQSNPNVEIGVSLTISAEIESSAEVTHTRPQYLHISAVNSGYTEAVNVRFKKVEISTGDGTIIALSLKVPHTHDAVASIGHNNASRGFPHTHDNFVFDISKLKSGGFTGVEVVANISYVYENMFGETLGDEGVWAGRFEETRGATTPDRIGSIRTNLARRE